MTCKTPEVVIEALKCQLCAARLGPYRVEYINDAGPYAGVDSEHLAMLQRDSSVVGLVDIESEYFATLVRHYGAVGEMERS